MTIPEGRTPLTWQDMPFADKPKGHPSTFEAECKQLRARVAELEAALLQISVGNSLSPLTLEGARYIARTVLNPPQEPPEATTDPL